MRKFFEIGGLVAAAALIVFGAVAISMGVSGRHTVDKSLSNEYIVASPDMTPTAIKAEATKAHIANVVKDWPTMSLVKTVNGKPTGVAIDTGARARAMAQYMHIHALEASGGLTYAQMPRYASPNGKGTNDPNAASKGPGGQPLDNPARNIWINETALATALNTSYMASQLGLFGIVVGIALLLSGFGFAILAIGGALRNPETAITFLRRSTGKTPAVPVA